MANEITIYKQQTAYDVRKEIVARKEFETLPSVERNILQASVRTRIKDLAPEEVAEKLKKMLHFIAIDVGYKITNAAEWQYTQTRIFDIVTKYYGELTLAEIKLAFELAMVGELNEYIPNGDIKHYQQFNGEYVSRILNAYKKRQNDAIVKAYEAIPSEPVRISQNDIERGKRFMASKFRKAYYEYKYRGIVDDSVFAMHVFVYNWLCKIGYAEQFKVIDADRKRAYAEYQREAYKGRKNKYEAGRVRVEGYLSNILDYQAEKHAKRREIGKAFERMLKDDVNIADCTML